MKEKAKMILTGLLAFSKKIFKKSEISPIEFFLKDVSLNEERDFEKRVWQLQYRAKIVLNEIEAIFIKLQGIIPLLPFYRLELETNLMQGDSVWKIVRNIRVQYQLKVKKRLKKKLLKIFFKLKEDEVLTVNPFTQKSGGDRSRLFPWEKQYVKLQGGD